MGRLERFLAKEEIIQLNGEDFKVPPLTIGDLPLVLGAYKGETVDPEGMYSLIMRYLKLNFPEENEEQLKKFPFVYMSDIMNAIIRVNGMTQDERILRIKEKIAARQAEKEKT